MQILYYAEIDKYIIKWNLTNYIISFNAET